MSISQGLIKTACLVFGFTSVGFFSLSSGFLKVSDQPKAFSTLIDASITPPLKSNIIATANHAPLSHLFS